MAIVEELDLRARFEREQGRVLLTGIQALVRLPVEQRRADARRGLRTAAFVTGYEGSPLAGYDLALQREAKLLREHDVHFRPALNEEIAATSLWGTQQIPQPREGVDGVVGVWYGKAPGLDRAHDAMRHANLVGASKHGGVLALVGDDPGCKSSTLASATEGALSDLGMPVLYPGDPQETLDYGLHGIALSRFCGSWVGLKIVADVADAVGTVEVGPERVAPTLPEVVIDGKPWTHSQIPQTVPPIVVTAEPQVFRNRVIAARLYAAANGLNRIVVDPPEARIGLVAAGKTYYETRQALADFGLDDAELARRGIRILKLGMISPVEPGIVREFARGLEEIVVVEEKRAFIERQIKDILYHAPERPTVVGKEDEEGRPLVPVDGELTPDRVAPALAARLSRYLGEAPFEERLQALRRAAGRTALPVVAPRAPFFCSGCPHNRSTVVPDGSLVGAGIGCHTLVQLSNDPRRVGAGLTQMGGEGAQWIGQAPFSEAGHLFQNLGDGTFFHSGSLAIRAAVASGVNITYKLLYNGHVAMTGGQTAVGAKAVPEVARMLLDEGVKRVIVLTDEPDKYPAGTVWPAGVEPWSRDRLDEAQRALRDIPGATALIYDQQCATEARRMRKRGVIAERATRVLINELVCEGCGDCGQASNCLSVQPIDTEFGRKTRIHQSSCNTDYSCLKGDCPAFVTVTPREQGTGNREQKGPVAEPAVALPEPEIAPVGDGFNLYLMGIGGTGVVTANHVLATAATMEGRWVTGLDQLGLSQKAGPVVSHLRITAERSEAANRVTAATADAYLAFDALLATEARSLAVAGPERTIAIVSTSATPTGAMVRDHDLRFPGGDAIRERIDAATRADRNVYLDAAAIAERLLRNHMAANIVVIGAACQAGALPVSPAAIEKAIELNGVAVPLNLAAFRWGRCAVAAPDIVAAALARHAPNAPTPGGAGLPIDARIDALLAGARLAPEVLRLTRIRANELLAYQDLALARGYARFVQEAADAEARVAPDDARLSAAVARYLYKLLAYKDEYEVARLYVDPRFEQALAEQFPEGGRVAYHLHPPMLRALGMEGKLELGPWFRPAFQALYAMRRLRGTPLDPFGRAEVRQIERKLIGDYVARVRKALATLTPETYERAVALAELPDMIRGYEEIKLRNVERYREALAAHANGAGA